MVVVVHGCVHMGVRMCAHVYTLNSHVPPRIHMKACMLTCVSEHGGIGRKEG